MRDEALWKAKIHPTRIGARLAPVELETLRKELRKILLKAIELRGSSISDFVDAGRHPGRLSATPQSVRARRGELFSLRCKNQENHRRWTQQPFLSALPAGAAWREPSTSPFQKKHETQPAPRNVEEIAGGARGMRSCRETKWFGVRVQLAI
jgi:hypothetical protein